MSHSREEPPTQWAGLDEIGITRVTDDIYFGWLASEPNPTFWHWCTANDRWVAANTGSHRLIAREPLHLEPSLLWPCCGLHGWIRNGTWANA